MRIIITDITSGQRNQCFTEIEPHRVVIPTIYGIMYLIAALGRGICF